MKLLSEIVHEAQSQRQRLVSELGNLNDHIRSLNERRSFVQSELSKIECAPAGLVGQDMPASKKIKFQSPKPVLSRWASKNCCSPDTSTPLSEP